MKQKNKNSSGKSFYADKRKFITKLVWTIIALVAIQILGMVPVYGVNDTFMTNFMQRGEMFQFLDNMTGGTLSKLSFTGFAIPSYITGSIMLQLVGIVFPRLDKIRADGETGRKFYEKVTFVVAMILTIGYALILAVGFGKLGIIETYTISGIAPAIICWTLGTIVTVLIANRITDKGIGNGISMLLGLNILSRIPSDLKTFTSSSLTENVIQTVFLFAVLCAAAFVVIFIAVYMQCSVLSIPIRQSQKEASVLNTAGYIPIGAGVANVLPSIYAMNLISFPVILASSGKIATDGTIFGKVTDALTSEYWYAPTEWYHVAGFAVYLLLMVALGLFASRVSFCSEEIADTMKKSGSVIPGINPGTDTVKYLEKCRKIMAMINVLFLVILTVGPGILCSKLSVTGLSFAGTSVVIIVNTLFDTWIRGYGAYLPVSKKYLVKGGKKN